MIYAALNLAHLLAIIVWIGGMVFAYFFLRPATLALEPPLRLRLMDDALGRFFKAALISAVIVLASGLWMIGRVAKQSVQAGQGFDMPLSWWIMALLGVVMIGILGHIRFALYKRLSKAVAASNWTAGGAALASIRTWVAINLSIGVVIIAVILLLG